MCGYLWTGDRVRRAAGNCYRPTPEKAAIHVNEQLPATDIRTVTIMTITRARQSEALFLYVGIQFGKATDIILTMKNLGNSLYRATNRLFKISLGDTLLINVNILVRQTFPLTQILCADTKTTTRTTEDSKPFHEVPQTC